MQKRIAAKLFCLSSDYSTTRIVSKEWPVIENPPYAKFQSMLFPPPNQRRIGEGGLRTKGYFKQSLQDKPLITIVTVVFNGIAHLEATILSVINQTYDNIEYLIIDGGSSDGTLDIIKKYEAQIDYWVSEEDKGIYDAWNKGVMASLGNWIGFLGADDVYLPSALKKYSAVLIESPDLNYVSTKVELVYEQKVIRIIGSAWSWNTFKRYMNCAHVGSLHARQLFYNNGLYDKRLKIAGDYELLLRAGSSLKSAYIQEITARMTIGGVSDSALWVLWETARAKIKTGNRNSILAYCEMFYAFIKWRLRKKLWY